MRDRFYGKRVDACFSVVGRVKLSGDDNARKILGSILTELGEVGWFPTNLRGLSDIMRA